MIYGRFGDEVTVVRRGTLDDVQALDGRRPDARDHACVEAGSYVVVRYADNGKEALYHIGYLKADEGAREIEAALGGMPA